MQEQASLNGFLGKVRAADSAARVAAVEQAAEVGPGAIVPLGGILGGEDPSAARTSQEAMRRIVFHAARSAGSAKAASAQLAQLTSKDRPYKVRSEALSLLGFVGDSAAIKALKQLLSDPEARENARMALERIPGKEAEAALVAAAKTVPADYRSAIQQSLRHRHQTNKDIGTRALE